MLLLNVHPGKKLMAKKTTSRFLHAGYHLGCQTHILLGENRDE